METVSNRPCNSCKGSKKSSWDDKPCFACQGKGEFTPPDFKAILAAITKTTKTGRAFRQSKPKFENEYRNRDEGRAYFVWRWTRFHGGADVTMPVCACSAVHGDPFFDEMEAFASILAKKVYGTDKAAAYRWMNALGHDLPVPADQPASAFPCGPVADEHKPQTEEAELCL